MRQSFSSSSSSSSSRATLALSVASIFLASVAFGQVVGFDAFRYENHFGGTWGAVNATNTGNDFINFTSDGEPGGIFVGASQNGSSCPDGRCINIDPANYELQVTYRLGDANQAFGFNLEVRQDDGDDGSTADTGFNPDSAGDPVTQSQVGTGLDLGENFQWTFPDMDLDYQEAVDAGLADEDGFVTLTRQIWDPATEAGVFDNTFRAFGYEEVGDGLLDWNSFEGGRPNGIIEMQIQAVGGGALDIDVQSVLLVPTDPAASLVEFGRSGISGSFGAASAQDGDTSPRYSRGDGTDFTNVILDYRPIDGVQSSGTFIDVPPSAVSIDGTEYSLELKGRLLDGNTASELVVEIFDVDGFAPDDDGTRDGFVDASVDQLGIVFDITQLNDQEITTLTIPISDVLDPDSPSFLNSDITNFGAEAVGDGDITSLDIHRFSVNSVFQSLDRLNIEIESIRFVANSPVTDVICDFDGDGDCDLVDIDTLYDNFGAVGGEFDVDGSGAVDGGDIGAWLTAADNFVIGDVNLDGSVNSTDLGLLLNNFNNQDGLAYSSGNLNDDANIDSTDLGLLLNNFGVSAASAAVPEPGSLPLLVMAAAAMIGLVRRR